jgi:hypothetical protein
MQASQPKISIDRLHNHELLLVTACSAEVHGQKNKKASQLS